MEAKDMFMAALQHLVETTKQIAQKDIADTSGIAPQTISNFVRGHKEPGLSSQERIAQACGYDLLDFLALGKTILEGSEEPQAAPDNKEDLRPLSLFSDKPQTLSTYAVASVTALVEEHKTIEKKLRFWQACIEAMVDPVCIVKDGIVIRQNQRARAWGMLVGKPLCRNCTDGKCDMTCQGDSCAIREAQRHGLPSKRLKDTPHGQAVVTCSPMVFEGEEFYIVTSTLIEDLPVRLFR